MPQHSSAHKELVIYADLMLWLKTTDPQVFLGLTTVYTDNLSRLYVREVADFLEAAKQRLLSKEAKGKHSKFGNIVGILWCRSQSLYMSAVGRGGGGGGGRGFSWP